MNWPTDKNEQIKLLAIIGAVVVGVGVGLYFAFSYLSDEKKKATGSIQQLEKDIAAAESEIAKIPKDKEANIAAVLKVKEASEKYFLYPTFGTYVLNATTMIEGWSKRVALQDVKVSEAGFAENLSTARTKSMRMYVARVTLVSTLYDLEVFLKEIETSNPYVVVGNLGIMPQGDPRAGKHSSSFEIQIPIWIAADMPETLGKRLESATNFTEKAAENVSKKK
jgi:hypothetical protein